MPHLEAPSFTDLYESEPDLLYRSRQLAFDEDEERRQAEEAIRRQMRAAAAPNILERALDLLGRPAQAIRGGIAGLSPVFGGPELIPGGANPLAGLALGLQGRGPESTAALLESAGWGTAPVGPFDTRGLFGFAADIPLDPLSFLPLGQVARGRQALQALPIPEAATITFPRLGEVAAEVFRATPAREAVHAVVERNIPLVSGITRRLTEGLDPTLARDNPLAQSIDAYQALVDRAPGLVNMHLAPARALGVQFEIDDVGRVLLADGTRRAGSDVFEQPGRFLTEGKITPDQATAIRTYWRSIDDVAGEYTARYNQLERLSPQLAEPFKIELISPGGLREHYVPRYYQSPEGTILREAPPGSRRTFQFEREYTTQEEALQQGFKALSPAQSIERHLQDQMEKMAQMDFAAQAATHGSIPLTHKGRSIAQYGQGLEPSGIPFLHGVLFEPSIAREINQALGAKAHPALEFLAETTSIARTMQTSFDISASFIQGLLRGASNPEDWLRSFVHGIDTWRDPIAHQRFLASPIARDTIQQTGGRIAVSGATEFTEGIRSGGWLAENLPKIPGVGPLLLQGVQRSMASFDAFGDMTRIYWAAAELPVAQRAGQVPELTDIINHATGAFSSRAIGLGPNQRALESSLLFAPRFLRGSLAVVGDILNGELAQKEAMLALGNLMVAGTFWYRHVAQAAGQTPVLDPTDPRFMTIDVANTRVGIGTTWIALARLLGKAVVFPTDPVIDPDWIENPLVRFWRGRLSPLAASVWDIAQHETYDRQALGMNPIDISRFLGSRFLPMALQAAIIDEGKPEQRLTSAATGLLGLRAFPETTRDIETRLAREQYGRRFEELLPTERARIRATEEVRGARIPSGPSFERRREIEIAQVQYRTGVEQAAARVTSGLETKEWFRERVADLAGDRRVRVEPNIEKFRPRTEAESHSRQYLDLLAPDPQTGRRDYVRAEEFLGALPASSQRYIKDAQMAGIERVNPEAQALLRDLWQARETLRPYREVRQRVYEALGLSRQDFLMAGSARRESLSRQPIYVLADRLSGRIQDDIRRRTPRIDRELVEWYGAIPMLMQAIQRETGQALPITGPEFLRLLEPR